jgi:hypothetical protein
MTNIIVEAEVSLDGITGGDNYEFWAQIFKYHSDDVTDYLNRLIEEPEALLLGRITYQGFAEIWPSRTGAMADTINAMPKYVASRTLAGTFDVERDADQGRYRGRDCQAEARVRPSPPAVRHR